MLGPPAGGVKAACRVAVMSSAALATAAVLVPTARRGRPQRAGH